MSYSDVSWISNLARSHVFPLYIASQKLHHFNFLVFFHFVTIVFKIIDCGSGSTHCENASQVDCVSNRKERQKVSYRSCREASKLRTHPLKDIPLHDRLYVRITVSFNEGWQPRAGASQLLRDQPIPFPQVVESDEEVEPVGPTGKSRPRGNSKAAASRKQANPDKWDRHTTAIEDHRKFWKGGRETFESLNPFICAVCMQEFLKITTLNHESELYWAAFDYLASNESGRQVFQMKLRR
ncbi:unnamed protein product [Eruca vesicaria subsp. sativa]|uniref:Uncharacterized protein n=1 Tax=Eruca vesicaria subsp. sativa TaxID=29727 RepID=A0ABC8L3D0_ERUVS|nr:unnamed protein product [Eruca vesicaria subsp. sativa]